MTSDDEFLIKVDKDGWVFDFQHPYEEGEVFSEHYISEREYMRL